MEQTEIMAEHTSSSHAGQQGGGAFLVTTLTIRDRERTVYAFYENDHAAELSCLLFIGDYFNDPRFRKYLCGQGEKYRCQYQRGLYRDCKRAALLLRLK